MVSTQRETRLSDRFKITQITVEARYADAFLIWDYSGRIWTEIAEIFPNLSVSDANPNRVTFSADSRWVLEVTLNSTRLTDSNPTSTFDKEADKVERFFEIVARHLKVKTITRLGVLLVQTLTATSEEDLDLQTANLMMKEKKLAKFFDVSGTKKCLPTIQLNVEDDDLGYGLKIQPEIRTAEIKVGVGETLLKNRTEKDYRINLSVDHYTLKPVDIEQLKLKDILKRVKHVTNRDTEQLLSQIGVVQ